MPDVIYRFKDSRTGRWVYVNEANLGDYPDAIVYMRMDDGQKQDLGTVRSLGMAYENYEPDLTSEQRLNRLGIFFNESTKRWEGGNGRLTFNVNQKVVGNPQDNPDNQLTREERLARLGFVMNPETGRWEAGSGRIDFSRKTPRNQRQQEPAPYWTDENGVTRNVEPVSLTQQGKRQVIPAPYWTDENGVTRNVEPVSLTQQGKRQVITQTAKEAPRPNAAREILDAEINGVGPYGEPLRRTTDWVDAPQSQPIGQTEDGYVDQLLEDIQTPIPQNLQVTENVQPQSNVSAGLPSQRQGTPEAEAWQIKMKQEEDIRSVQGFIEDFTIKNGRSPSRDEVMRLHPLWNMNRTNNASEPPLSFRNNLSLDELNEITGGNYAVRSPDAGDGDGDLFEIYTQGGVPVVLDPNEIANASSKIDSNTPLFGVNADGTYVPLGTLASPDDVESIMRSDLGAKLVPQANVTLGAVADSVPQSGARYTLNDYIQGKEIPLNQYLRLANNNVNIKDTHPYARYALDTFANTMASIGVPVITVNEGYRNNASQRALIGRPNAAKTTRSMHGFGTAFDLHWNGNDGLLAMTQAAVNKNPELLKQYGAKNAENLIDIIAEQSGLERNLHKAGMKQEQHHFGLLENDLYKQYVNAALIAEERKKALSGLKPGSAYLIGVR